MFAGGLVQRSMEVNTEAVKVKVETSEVEQFETLFIEEEGDEIKSEEDYSEKSSKSTVSKTNDEDTEDREGETGKDGGVEGGDRETGIKDVIKDTCVGKETQNEGETEDKTEEVNLKQSRGDVEADLRAAENEEDKIEKMGVENQSPEERTAEGGREGSEAEEDVNTESAIVKDTEGGQGQERQQDTRGVKPEAQLLDPRSAAVRSKDRLSPHDAQKQIRRLTPDFPDSLYELLCSLQEGRRLNDQRCSFTLERRCHSEPSTPVPRHRVVFSSMTSLQKEEFFDLLVTSQGRRMDDQRAELQDTPEPQPPPQPKANERKFSFKGLEPKAAAPKPPPKEELYNMILTVQAQGRIEEQRSRAPGPMDDEDFFSLLLRVQGGRMDEQRTELPITLQD